ncbi:alpha/beta hydrolase [Pseudomonas cedrina]|uniref:alpha/beta hydrolase n=1 Tax=Pseudomonas cedrina TaxID=651740 RepID=UPI003ED900FD
MALKFDKDGLLTPGTFTVEPGEFLSVFCTDRTTDSCIVLRNKFYKPFLDITEWAEDMGATSLVIGGSFVSQKPSPNDLDILVFFSTSNMIPKPSEVYDVDGVRLDIQMLAEDQEYIKSAFLELLSTTRQGVKHGLIQIKLHSSAMVHLAPEDRSKDFEVVKAAYLGRHIQLQAAKGVIIPIHGILTHADWMPHLTLLASASGWAVAPYVYGYKNVTLLSNSAEKRRIVEGFRDWISIVKDNYDGPISIVAHSFGTYIIGRYLTDAGDISEKFDAIILCGSILSKNFSWGTYLTSAKVGKVLNVISENDEWVKFLPEGGVRLLASDVFFGKAGCEGFNYQDERLMQIKSALLRHNNVFKTDIIKGLWLPFLKLAHGSQYRAMHEKITREHATLKQQKNAPSQEN